jgi:hypothetical protein
MSRPHVEPALGSRIDPAAMGASAREHQRVLAILVNHRKFKLAVERGG